MQNEAVEYLESSDVSILLVFHHHSHLNKDKI